MFTAKLKEAGLFKRIVESIKDLVSVVNFDISGEGISFQAMDQSHVALVSLHLSSEVFQDYRCDRKFSLGIKLQNLHKILKCGENGDVLTLECDQEDPQVLNLRFESLKHEKTSRFALNLVNQEEEQLQLPDSTYAAKVVLPSGEFLRIVREMTQLAENIAIKVSKKTIAFEVKGDVTSGCIELKANNSDKESEQVKVEVDEESVRNTFALSFLNSFCKAAVLSEQVLLAMSENAPVVVEYKVNGNSHLKFYLAPKIDE